ncbi:MAG: sodium-dependent transporter [Halanaerobiales bacterium]
MKRDRWNTRAAFVLAAIGSAAGLGNAWRFPYMAYKNGGGAFLIPYFIALLVAGIPLIVLEFSLGQKQQLGAAAAMGKIKKKFEGFGWWTIVCAFVIVSYYVGIIGYTWDYIYGYIEGAAQVSDTTSYFYNQIVQISSGPGNIAGFSIPVLIGVVITWIAIYFILRNGTDSVSKVVAFTVGLPILLLVILIINSLRLPGAIEGINYYLRPDFGALQNPQVWIDAFSQVFFTLSLGMGIMIAYASYMPEDSDIVNNALITVLANSGVSFMAGFAVFGTLGYMAQNQGEEIKDIAAGGIGLAFEVYPKAINLLPGGPLVIGFFGVVFFMMLLTLGIDSAFSLVESAVAGVVDKWNLNKRKVTLGVIIALGITSLLFATKAGLYWLDIVDHYLLTYGLVAGGIFELLVIGWSYKPATLREYFNPISEYKLGKWWDIMVKYITPLVLLFLFFFNMYNDVTELYEGYSIQYQWIGGWGLLAVLAVFTYYLSIVKDSSLHMLYLLGSFTLIVTGLVFIYYNALIMGLPLIILGNIVWRMFYEATRSLQGINQKLNA